MGKMESTLRGEIARLARKEIAFAVGPLTKQLVEFKKQVRTLKKAAAAGKPVAAVKPTKLELPSGKEVAESRIGPRWIKALRKRLGLSQGKLADIVGVSMSAVGSWEYGRAKPGGKNKAALVALRKLNKKGLRAMLGAGDAKAPAKPKKPVKKKPAAKNKPAPARPKPKANAPKKKPVKKKASKAKTSAKKSSRKRPKTAAPPRSAISRPKPKK